MSVEAVGRVFWRGWPVCALLLAAGTGMLAAGCTAESGSAQTKSPAVTATASLAPTVVERETLSPGDLVFADLGPSGVWFAKYPLSDLSPDVAEPVAELHGDVGIAVLVPSLGAVYELNGGLQFELASVAKVPIMLTLLDQAIRQGRELTAYELHELTQMIMESDNEATDWLYGDVGLAPGVTAFLNSANIYGARFGSDWGESTLSPLDAATLMAELAGGTILDAPSRELAMSLLGSVDPAQDWGAVLTASYLGQTGVKNGWYPELDGWVINSTGFVLDSGAAPDYSIAIFSSGQPAFYEGIRTIELIGQRVYQALVAQAGSR